VASAPGCFHRAAQQLGVPDARAVLMLQQLQQHRGAQSVLQRTTDPAVAGFPLQADERNLKKSASHASFPAGGDVDRKQGARTNKACVPRGLVQ